MCDAFAGMLDVELILPKRFQDPERKDISIHKYYGLEHDFRVRWLSSFNITPPSGRLSKYTQTLQRLYRPIACALFGLASALYCRKQKPEYIYTRDFTACLFAYLFNGDKVFCEAHDFPGTALGRWLKPRVVRDIGGLVCISNGLAWEYTKAGVDIERIRVAHNGTDFKGGVNGRPIAMPPYKKAIGYIGHLYPSKGVYTLAEAMKGLDDYVLFVIGGTYGDIVEFMKFKIFHHLNNVIVAGYMEHDAACELLPRFDVLVVPHSAKDINMRDHACPLKVLEYMASGKPIVASDLPAIREMLDENTAVMVKPDCAESLAEGIRQVLQDGGLGEKLASNAYKKVQEYTWTNRARNILEFMEGR